MLDDDAPISTANFLNYLARYDSTIIHRSVREGIDVIQGGGFVVDQISSEITAVATDSPIVNEFDPARLNIRGSISMARTSDPDSATSQWFINVNDNASLDATGNQYAVFGYVIGEGIQIVDDIASIAIYDVATLTGESALNEVPLQGYTEFSNSIAGTVSINEGSATVIGLGTSFRSDIPGDSRIQIGGVSYDVAVVSSDTELTLTTGAQTTLANVAAQVNAVPISTQYIVIDRVSDVIGTPQVSLVATTTALDENSDTTDSIKVADILVNDNGSPGTNTLTLSGPDASHFTIVNDSELHLKAGETLDFETNSQYTVIVNVDDDVSAGTPDGSATFVLSINDLNEAPTAITLGNPVTELAENANTAGDITLASIVVTDDALGDNQLSLSGPDAALLQIKNGQLVLPAGTILDFETKSTYQVTVLVDDPNVGSTPDASVEYTLTITDTNDPPTIMLSNIVSELPEDTNTSAPIKLADIVVIDDAQGSNTTSLAGDDAAFFEIVGSELFLKAGVTLDFETKSSYSIVVQVDDLDIVGSPDDSVVYMLTITDVLEP